MLVTPLCQVITAIF